MYFYVLSAVITWITIRFVWNYVQTCRRVAPIPKLYPQHFFWGFLHKAQTADALLHMCLDYVRQTRATWFVGWNMCFFPVLFPTDPETIRAVLTATNVPKNTGFIGLYRMLKPWIGDGLVISNGQKWERSRHLLTLAFHFDILKGYTRTFNETADIFVEKLRELSKIGKSFDVFPPVCSATLDAILRCSMSYTDNSIQSNAGYHPYGTAVNRMLNLLVQRMLNPILYPDWIFGLSAVGKEFHALCDYVHSFSGDIISSRRRALEENPEASKKRHLDFLDILLTAKDSDGQGLTDLEIRDEVDTFVVAAQDTSCCAISWTLNALAKYPAMQQKVRQEVDEVLNGRTDLGVEDLSKLQYTTRFIKESLRMYPPVVMTERKLSQPLDINGVTFKPGQVIFTSPYLVHHNPKVWEDPEKFKPDRFLTENIKGKDPFAFIPFSAGQRSCIGQNFAMNEIKVTIAKVVSRFDISEDPNRPAEPYAEAVLRAKDGVFLHFNERRG